MVCLRKRQRYQLCKCNAASFKMLCNVEYANAEQSLVRLFDFRLLETLSSLRIEFRIEKKIDKSFAKYFR